jgi:hypothetical protein
MSAGTWQILVNGHPVVDPGPMVALGSEVLFAENPLLGNNNQVGLWVSDGTSFGTSEISVAGASTFGAEPTDYPVASLAHPSLSLRARPGTTRVSNRGRNMPSPQFDPTMRARP